MLETVDSYGVVLSWQNYFPKQAYAEQSRNLAEEYMRRKKSWCIFSCFVQYFVKERSIQ